MPPSTQIRYVTHSDAHTHQRAVQDSRRRARTQSIPHDSCAAHGISPGTRSPEGKTILRASHHLASVAIRARRPVSSRYTRGYKRAADPPRPPHVVSEPRQNAAAVDPARLGITTSTRHTAAPGLERSRCGLTANSRAPPVATGLAQSPPSSAARLRQAHPPRATGRRGRPQPVPWASPARSSRQPLELRTPPLPSQQRPTGRRLPPPPVHLDGWGVHWRYFQLLAPPRGVEVGGLVAA